MNTRFELIATTHDGEVFTLDFELPGQINAEQWDATKEKFQKLLNVMATPVEQAPIVEDTDTTTTMCMDTEIVKEVITNE